MSSDVIVTGMPDLDPNASLDSGLTPTGTIFTSLKTLSHITGIKLDIPSIDITYITLQYVPHFGGNITEIDPLLLVSYKMVLDCA